MVFLSGGFDGPFVETSPEKVGATMKGVKNKYVCTCIVHGFYQGKFFNSKKPQSKGTLRVLRT